MASKQQVYYQKKIIIIALCIFLAVVGVLYLLVTRNNQLTSNSTPTDKQPLPTSIGQVNTHDAWKTYINTSPYFRINYPSVGVTQTNMGLNPPLIIELLYYGPNNTHAKNVVGGIDLTDGYLIKIDWENSIQADYKNNNEDNAIFTNPEKTSLAGMPAYKFDTQARSFTTTTYIVSNGTKIFVIDLNAFGSKNDRQTYINMMEQILSTFKFITP